MSKKYPRKAYTKTKVTINGQDYYLSPDETTVIRNGKVHVVLKDIADIIEPIATEVSELRTRPVRNRP